MAGNRLRIVSSLLGIKALCLRHCERSVLIKPGNKSTLVPAPAKPRFLGAGDAGGGGIAPPYATPRSFATNQ